MAEEIDKPFRCADDDYGGSNSVHRCVAAAVAAAPTVWRCDAATAAAALRYVPAFLVPHSLPTSALLLPAALYYTFSLY